MSDRFFDGRRMDNKLVGNFTRYNSSISDTIKSIEENNKEDFNWKIFGLGVAGAFLSAGASYGTHRLGNYIMYERPERIRQEAERIRQETPPEINVEAVIELE